MLQNRRFSALASRSGFGAANRCHLWSRVEQLSLLRFATQCLQIAVEWLRQGSSAAAAASVILLRFAPESRKLPWNGCVKVANGVLAADFSHFGIDDVPFIFLLKSASKSSLFPLWHRDPVLELQNRCNGSINNHNNNNNNNNNNHDDDDDDDDDDDEGRRRQQAACLRSSAGHCINVIWLPGTLESWEEQGRGEKSWAEEGRDGTTVRAVEKSCKNWEELRWCEKRWEAAVTIEKGWGKMTTNSEDRVAKLWGFGASPIGKTCFWIL